DANGNASQVALTASLFSIVVWAVAAWYFVIPTSESHALIAGLTGSAMPLGGLGAVNGSEWIKVLVGLDVCTVMGFGGEYLIA
ncbi:inorganic phosphate transporter, partial [Enterococcus faecalis]|uniref:inorganic phosphate transporter n=1 Tax=Enterococcus faecalis TaxID=1351 RepID=UPI003D6A7002